MIISHGGIDLDFTIKLPEEKMNNVLKWLGKGPFDEVASLINEIMNQCRAQMPQQQTNGLNVAQPEVQ